MTQTMSLSSHLLKKRHNTVEFIISLDAEGPSCGFLVWNRLRIAPMHETIVRSAGEVDWVFYDGMHGALQEFNYEEYI